MVRNWGNKIYLERLTNELFCPKNALTVACCLFANMEKMVAKRMGLAFLCFEQRGLEILGLN